MLSHSLAENNHFFDVIRFSSFDVRHLLVNKKFQISATIFALVSKWELPIASYCTASCIAPWVVMASDGIFRLSEVKVNHFAQILDRVK